ncbi:probable phosphorylase b kinase regulatory subunit beta isoform X4 [Eurytemora carolleeae]|uniref:probable phosphorylase b kinase regulatory subunit beta isoform X3 n=1 Tax=Eurytemora carolleeae TaxID=1294199 RepID=UPI000C76C1B4|nr:probable phosphorylase b kinase regulatory subunit beta isoform X3 [Eurytemora carolleeae]XP_023336393.1 probable phosphorylase b kinase regulatory subunit beta isoform X4 [Eurytemora carolleeae]|eukprot:XP_023336391.1 probable phosphorylase b kinase regulatory subunit beta isoform X3 [Eurytemora affinis]
MRGILACWMRQSKKLESWKSSQNPTQSLHSVFCLNTGDEVLTTSEYSHLQLDCVSLYLLYLVQMISSGLEIIYSTEEVSMVQNLVYYVERAYRTPDYGIWGRGTKYNDGSPEVNASSIGLTKAALEAVNGFNLLGDKRGNHAVIYADIDAHNRNRSIFETLLPRESNTKNTDAALLATISYPGFATHDPNMYNRTKNRIVRELEGEYGFKRFIGDGFGSEAEEKGRRFYETGETLEFEHVENEWPLFYLYMIIDAVYKDLPDQEAKYQDKLEKLLIYDAAGDPVVPRMFIVPKMCIKNEKMSPKSQNRKASNINQIGLSTGIFLWAQSLYIISSLLTKKLLHLWDIDPIRRYLPCFNRPRPDSRYSSFLGGSSPTELVVQVVMIAETTRLQAMLANYGIQTQTPTEVEPVEIWNSAELVKVYKSMGECEKLGLNGRPPRPIGSLGTSKIYRICGRTVLCYPIIFSGSDFYLSHDMALLTNDIRSELQFIGRFWRLGGRPTFCILISENNMRDPQFIVMLELLAEMKEGQCSGVKIRLGRLQNLISSACVEHIDLVHGDPKFPAMKHIKENKNLYAGYQSLTDIPKVVQINEEYHDYAKEYENTPTHEILEVLRNLNHLYGRIQLCGIILEREDSNFQIEEGLSVWKMIETLSVEAERLRYWAALRYSSSLLKRTVNSLSPYATQIIVNGKSLTVGTIKLPPVSFHKPMTPKEIHDALFKRVFPYSIIGAVLQQELILNCGKLIATNPELFKGILVIRIGWILKTLELYLKFTDPSSPGFLDNLPPSKIQRLLLEMMRVTSGKGPIIHELTDYQIKQMNGCLLRVPDNFYPSIWQILTKCGGGIRFGSELLPQLPTIRLHESHELSFYHLVESHFTQYRNSCQRYLVTRILTILAIVLKRNPEINYKAVISVEELMQATLELYEKDGTEKTSCCGMEGLYRLSCRAGDSYIGRAIVNRLLGGEIDQEDSSCKIQ